MKSLPAESLSRGRYFHSQPSAAPTYSSSKRSFYLRLDVDSVYACVTRVQLRLCAYNQQTGVCLHYKPRQNCIVPVAGLLSVLLPTRRLESIFWFLRVCFARRVEETDLCWIRSTHALGVLVSSVEFILTSDLTTSLLVKLLSRTVFLVPLLTFIFGLLLRRETEVD